MLIKMKRWNNAWVLYLLFITKFYLPKVYSAHKGRSKALWCYQQNCDQLMIKSLQPPWDSYLSELNVFHDTWTNKETTSDVPFVFGFQSNWWDRPSLPSDKSWRSEFSQTKAIHLWGVWTCHFTFFFPLFFLCFQARSNCDALVMFLVHSNLRYCWFLSSHTGLELSHFSRKAKLVLINTNLLGVIKCQRLIRSTLHDKILGQILQMWDFVAQTSYQSLWASCAI